MLTAAIEAGTPEAKETPTPSFGSAGSVVLGEVVAARALTTSPRPLGIIGAGPGSLSAGWLSFGSSEIAGTRMRSVAAEPAFDVFVADGVSLGAVIGAGVTHLSEDRPIAQALTLWHATVMPRVGNVFAITNGVALWTRMSAGFTFFDWAMQDDVGKIFRATVDAPFVFSLARHVALQTGPQVSYVQHLGGPTSWRGFSGGVSGGLSIVL